MLSNSRLDQKVELLIIKKRVIEYPMDVIIDVMISSSSLLRSFPSVVLANKFGYVATCIRKRVLTSSSLCIGDACDFQGGAVYQEMKYQRTGSCQISEYRRKKGKIPDSR